MFFSAATPTSCHVLLKILSQYKVASDQQISKNKSTITFSKKTPPEMKEEAKTIFDIVK